MSLQYSASLTDNDWSHILQNNLEAQDLLSTAIAHHEQYREDDPMKRKGAISQAHNKAPRMCVSSSLSLSLLPYALESNDASSVFSLFS